jgi:hypothetical protein
MADELSKHIARTYRGLRIGMVLVGILLPFVLWGWSSLEFNTWEPGQSVSGYYHSRDTYVRDILVGSLCATGVCLLFYRGFSSNENRLLNLAGICIVGVAWFPTTIDQAPRCTLKEGPAQASLERAPSTVSPADGRFSAHGVFAACFFVSLAIVATTQAGKSLHLVKDKALAARYRQTYRGLGISMVAIPILAWVYINFIKKWAWGTFALEALGVWIFAAYWLVKTHEFWGSHGECETKLIQDSPA